MTGATALASGLMLACGGGGANETKTSNTGSSGGNSGASGSSGLVSQPVDTLKQAKRGGVIKDRTFADPPSFDPYTANNPWNAIGPQVYSSLVQFKPGHLEPTQNEIVPDLVESWEFAPDHLAITMKLRQGVKWHNKAPVNGRVLDAEDILFSWKRFETKSTTRAAIAHSADPSAPVLSIEAPDPQTIVVKLQEPLVYALGFFATSSSGNVNILPKETDSTFDPKGDMIGTGPFYLEKYVPSDSFTLKKQPDHFDTDAALVDQIDEPIVSEYTSALAQLKAGNIYSMGSYVSTPGVSQDDILAVKSEEPRLLIYQGDLYSVGSPIARLEFGLKGDTPFLDARVRQAVSMAMDRDLFLDTFANVTRLATQGLDVQTAWNSSIAPTPYAGWWMDPRDKEFGEDAKYYMHDVDEAKKLLSAAGFPDGLKNIGSHYVTGPELGIAPKQAEVLDNMYRDAGIDSHTVSLDYLKEYVPNYRNGRGQYDGWAYKSTAGGASSGDAVGALSNEWWSKGGATFHGFSSDGTNDQSGDPQVDSMIEKARVEFDTEKRRALVKDIQRYLAKPQYAVSLPGYASQFVMAWPCLANFRVNQMARPNYFLWVDTTKAPFV
ncbi:MAG TPA: ABC transporter substrate-binding protein [Dehalococcoidia bacterium]|nr:ABC transporter substrate-binding protein [Dehalococcoidia bacterium]